MWPLTVKTPAHDLNTLLVVVFSGRGDGPQCDTPLQKEIRDHSPVQANMNTEKRDPARVSD